jgi:hypothetical protein
MTTPNSAVPYTMEDRKNAFLSCEKLSSEFFERCMGEKRLDHCSALERTVKMECFKHVEQKYPPILRPSFVARVTAEAKGLLGLK